MPDFWYNAEPIQKVMYAVILAGIPLLFLSAYKIWRWVQRENIAERLEKHREKQRENVFYELQRSVSRARFIWYCAGCAAVVFLSAILPEGWRVIGVIAGIAILYLVNNWIVTSRWRCPVCGERLPCLIGRSALRPRWTEYCLYCGYGKAQGASAK